VENREKRQPENNCPDSRKNDGFSPLVRICHDN
jgi:hypothetical protein